MGEASRQIMRQARQQVPEWSPPQVQDALAHQHEAGRDRKDIVLVDVREKHEWNEGYIPGAVHVPRGYLELQIEEAVPDKSKTVVLYCAGGVRSLMAGKTLQEMGYGKAISMSGGFGGWKGQGYAFVQPRTLNEAQTKRYSRHLLVPEVGEQGQIKLLDSRVLLIGAGGLGSPAAYYLAAAGVGTIGIIDADVVDDSNLERLDESNVASIIADYDVILDGTDNFPTCYLLNDAALIANKPVVHGSVFRFEGQLTVFKPYEGPCYRCLYPEPPPVALAPSCAEAGVLGVLPGVIGLLQATETIKLLL